MNDSEAPGSAGEAAEVQHSVKRECERRVVFIRAVPQALHASGAHRELSLR